VRPPFLFLDILFLRAVNPPFSPPTRERGAPFPSHISLSGRRSGLLWVSARAALFFVTNFVLVLVCAPAVNDSGFSTEKYNNSCLINGCGRPRSTPLSFFVFLYLTHRGCEFTSSGSIDCRGLLFSLTKFRGGLHSISLLNPPVHFYSEYLVRFVCAVPLPSFFFPTKRCPYWPLISSLGAKIEEAVFLLSPNGLIFSYSERPCETFLATSYGLPLPGKIHVWSVLFSPPFQTRLAAPLLPALV